MTKLTAVIGNTASGKTALARLLAERAGFTLLAEAHHTMLYQVDFAAAPGEYALQNQIDYLLYRAEQEHTARQSSTPSILDGGLDIDFHLFTRLFHHKGYLEDRGLSLCQRLYTHLRQTLPAIDHYITLKAPVEILQTRHTRRARQLDSQIVTPADIPFLQIQLDSWLQTLPPEKLIHIDINQEDPNFTQSLPRLLQLLK